MAVADQNACIGYGFQPGTDNYASCMFQLDQEHRSDARAGQERIRAGLKAFAAGLKKPEPKFRCNTDYSGNSSSTTCR